MLTPAQYAALAAHIRANTDPFVVANATPGIENGVEIAKFYNQLSDFVVWKTSLSRHDILTGTSDEGTTFSWAGPAYITRSQGERDAFREMFNSTGTVVPTKPTIQAAFNDIFSGTGGASNRAHIVAMSKRKATKMELVFATGIGTTADPGALQFEGDLMPDDVNNAMNRY